MRRPTDGLLRNDNDDNDDDDDEDDDEEESKFEAELLLSLLLFEAFLLQLLRFFLLLLLLLYSSFNSAIEFAFMSWSINNLKNRLPPPDLRPGVLALPELANRGCLFLDNDDGEEKEDEEEEKVVVELLSTRFFFSFAIFLVMPVVGLDAGEQTGASFLLSSVNSIVYFMV